MPAGASFTESDRSFAPSTKVSARYAMLGKTERGPLRTPTDIGSWDEYQRIFGNLLTSQDFPLQCKRALDGGARLSISRLVHYSNVTDVTTTAAAEASISINDRQTNATNPYLLSTVGPWNLYDQVGGYIRLDENGSPGPAVQLNATRASLESVAVTGNYTGGKTLTLKVGRKNTLQGSTVQTVSFVNGDFSDPTTPTANEVAKKISDSIYGGRARVTNTNKVTIESDILGSESVLEITGGTANALLSFSTSETLGTGGCKDASSVQPAEIKSLIDAAADATITVTVTTDNKVKVTSTAGSGASVYLGITATSTVAVALGWAEGVPGRQVGQNNAASPTLQVLGKYPGTYAAGWVVSISDRTQDLTGRFTLTIAVQSGVSTSETFTNLSMLSTSDRYAPNIVNDDVNGSKWIKLVDLVSNANTEALKRPATGNYTLAGGNDGLSGFADSDIIGDTTAKTGIYALDEIDAMNCQDVIIPYQIANATAQSLINYVESRKDMMLHLFRQLTNAASVADIVAWRNATGAYTGGTQFDSNYVALYAGSVKVTDPLSNTSRFILPGGDLAAALSLNDTGGGRLPEGESGTWLAPAGETRARLAVDGVQYDVGASGNSSFLRSLGDDNHINAIHRFDGKVIIGDAFTLWRSTTLTQWTNVRRLMIFTEVRIARLIQKYMYEPNNPVLWRKIYNKIKPFMDRMVGLGAFFEYRYDGDQDASGLSDAKVNSPDDITNGVFRCRLYVKPVPPARELKVEFIITKLSASFTEQLS